MQLSFLLDQRGGNCSDASDNHIGADSCDPFTNIMDKLKSQNINKTT